MSHTDWTKLLLIQTFLLKRSAPKKSLARPSSSAKNQCAPARRIWIHFWRIPLWILGEIQAETIGTRFARPTFWLPKIRLVLYWCLYCTKLEPISKIGNVIARAERVVALTKSVRSTNRPATASLRSATPKEKHSLHFWFGGGEISFEKGKGWFFFGGLPSKYSGSVAARNADSAKRKSFFLGGKDFLLCLG